MVQSSISYNINGANCPHPDVLQKHIQAINPRWLLIMDNPDMGKDYRRKFPNTNIVLRNWALTQGDEKVYSQLTPTQWLDARLPEAGDGLWLYTANEAGINAKWDIELMKLVLSRKLTHVNLMLGSPSVGTPAVDSWLTEDKREWFQLLDEHRNQFCLSLHEYFAGIAPSGFVGGYPDGSWSDGRTGLHPNYEDRRQWPLDASVIGALWHCGRFKVVNDAARSFGFMPPRILITEHGADDLSDIRLWAKKFPLSDGFSNHRSWKSLGAMWARLLPGRSTQQAYFENVNYLRTAVYGHFPNVEGQLIYGWTNSPDWKVFDVSEADEFMNLLEADVAKQQPKPSLPSFPADFDTRAKSYMVRGSDGSTTVRVLPSKNSSLLTTIAPTPSIIRLIDAGDLSADERVQETIGDRLGVWLPVAVGSIKGWSFNGYLDVHPVIVPPPDPTPTLVKWQVSIRAEYVGTPEEREASKQAFAGLADFVREYVHPAGSVPDVTVSEE